MAVMLTSAARHCVRNQSKTHPRAFTLLELIAVFIVLGLISSITMLSVIGHLDKAELIRVSQLIASADRKERDASRTSPFPGGLTIDKSMKRLQYSNSARSVDLGPNVKLAEVIMSPPHSSNDVILFSQSGQSLTYAFRLESRRKAMHWVLIIGMTGEVRITDNTVDVRSLFALGG